MKFYSVKYKLSYYSYSAIFFFLTQVVYYDWYAFSFEFYLFVGWAKRFHSLGRSLLYRSFDDGVSPGFRILIFKITLLLFSLKLKNNFFLSFGNSFVFKNAWYGFSTGVWMGFFSFREKETWEWVVEEQWTWEVRMKIKLVIPLKSSILVEL